jgi:hypothetical protein
MLLFMKRISLIQFQYEIASWKRLLDFIINENVYLKNQLAVVLKGKIDHQMLEESESLQNRFINEDEWVGLLRNEIAEVEKMLNKAIAENQLGSIQFDQSVSKLRNSIYNTEKQFEALRTTFINYLSENVKYG